MDTYKVKSPVESRCDNRVTTALLFRAQNNAD